MKRGKIILLSLVLLAVTCLCACQQDAKARAAGYVKNYVRSLREAKNLEYMSENYRRYSIGNPEVKQYRSETIRRQGKIEFEQKVFEELYCTGSSQLVNPQDIKKSLAQYGSTDFLLGTSKVYSSGANLIYRADIDTKKNWVWKAAKDIKAPEVGRSEAFLQVYEKYADQFQIREDEHYIYLHFQGDVKDNAEQIAALRDSFLESKLFGEGKKNVQSLELDIRLILKKDGGFIKKKLTPSEARIHIKTGLESEKDHGVVSNEDHFEASYRDINQIEKIQEPKGLPEK